MLEFEKDHYSLIELADRWQLPFREIEYHTERERLEVQVWVGDVPATRYILKKTEDGEDVPVPSGTTTLTGYFIVDGSELRKLFRAPGIPEIRKFQSLDRNEIYTLHPFRESIQIRLSALEVSRAECDRFEANKNVRPFIMPETNADIPSTPKGGRPSVMGDIIEHFNERRARGEAEGTPTAEARYLHAWAHNEWGDRAPGIKAIRNNLSPLFAAAQKDSIHR